MTTTGKRFCMAAGLLGLLILATALAEGLAGGADGQDAPAAPAQAPDAKAPSTAEPNTLTDAEKKDGWRLLFDGKTTTGWRGFKMDKMPPGWAAEGGALVRLKGGAGGKGAGGGDDIVTTEEFENFDLRIEWKLVAKGNSGVLYHVSEEPVTAWHCAPEVQLLDNTPGQTATRGNWPARATTSTPHPKT